MSNSISSRLKTRFQDLIVNALFSTSDNTEIEEPQTQSDSNQSEDTINIDDWVTPAYRNYGDRRMVFEQQLINTEMPSINEIRVKAHKAIFKAQPPITEDGEICVQSGKKFPREIMIPAFKDVTYTKEKGFSGTDCYVIEQDFTVVARDVNGEKIKIASRAEALKSGFIESLKDGYFYVDEDARSRYEQQKRPISYNRLGIKDTEHFNLSKQEEFKFGISSPADIISQHKGYTFGVEIETCKGYVPTYLYQDLNMKSVTDGSILDSNGNKSFGGGGQENYIGREYVTGVLTGDAGFKQLERICNTLSRRCSVNKTCGVHVHVGNVDFTKEMVVAVYMLALAIQDDIFSLLPPSRRRNPYCSDLKKFKFDLKGASSKEEREIRIDEYYTQLFVHLAGREPDRGCNKETDHPRGSRAGYNHSHPRYNWLNFLPAMFNLRNVRKYDPITKKDKITSYTLELRNHSGTTNYSKIKNWVLIAMAMVYCAENCQGAIINGEIKSVDDMIKLAYTGRRQEKLLRYTEKRRRLFSGENAEQAERKDYIKQKPGSVTDASLKELVQ